MTPRFACFARSAALLPALLAAAVPALATAHPGIGAGMTTGFAHPWSGLDHVLAMLAVGLWAAQLGGRALLVVPMSFLGLVACGAGLAAAGVAVPSAEVGIALSVVALGTCVAGAVRFPLLASAVLAGGFALFHGHAHANELAAGASELGRTLGFLAATALLHALGIAAAAPLARAARAPLLRASGAAIALVGLGLFWSAAL